MSRADKADRIIDRLNIVLKKAGRPSVARSAGRASSFKKIVSPAAMFGLEELRGQAPRHAKEIFAPSAWKNLSAHLKGRLAFVLAPTLRLECNAAKAVARSLGRPNTPRSDEAALLEMFAAFPGALETAAVLIADWIEAQLELFARLVRDRRILSSVFFRGGKGLRVVAIRPGLSDPHDGGRTVTLVEFAGKRRIIYKPRSFEGEALWFGALRWLNREAVHTRFRIPRFVQRSNYSWMEFVKARSCRTSQDARRFYFRWGAQTALAQILRASDLHWENWIAAGPQPVLVDAELIGAGRKDRQPLPALLETGLFPLTARDGAGAYKGIAPLGATLSRRAAARCWPRYRGALRTPRKYVNDLVRGFEAVAQMFATPDLAKTFFAEVIFPMTRKRTARLLFRASTQYARLLRESLEPVNMSSRGRRRRWLAQECIESAANRAIGCAEARALWRGDIPKFIARESHHPTWKQFSIAISELKSSEGLLRSRVLLGTRARPN